MLLKINVLLVMVLSIVACNDGDKNNIMKNNYTKAIVSSDIVNNISTKRIYFGHQSVGGNILEGVSEILSAEQKSKIEIIKTNDSDVLKKPIIMHTYLGENGDPKLKIDEFSHAIYNGVGNKADIAVFKFCYLDIDRNTDVNSIFSYYKQTINKIKADFPKLKVVHMTVPLTVREPFLRYYLKLILGKSDNNIIRAKYNNLVLSEYGGVDPVFDLATIESTNLDGSRDEYTSGEIKYYGLVKEFAADSGHLNEMGRAVIASRFVEFLSGL